MMGRRLKIYLGDLTYDTVSISTNAFPLNIGYIASACLKRFGSGIDITLFKYISPLVEAIKKDPPDILGLSNYCWNQNLGSEMFGLLHRTNPDAVTVWGGPNFPGDRTSQEIWLRRFPEVDAYVPIEGEIGFSNLVERVLGTDEIGNARRDLSATPINGCIIRGPDGTFHHGAMTCRIEALDEIPSPYLSGLLDKFFDARLQPMIQTNRGCPFSCIYCVDGSEKVNRVNQFTLRRVMDEIEYIAPRVDKKIHYLGISDSNFGMLPRDAEICEAIVRAQKKYHYPRHVGVSTGKNAKANIIHAIKRLKGSLSLMIAVQSMDEQVLMNIKRTNISAKEMLELAPVIKASGLRTKAEVILGLPGDTYESHMNTLKILAEAGMDEILVFTCMLLPGSELWSPEERRRWNFKTKYRVLPRDFAKLADGKLVIETEECVVASDRMSFEEYVELRLFNFIIYATNRGIVYEPILNFLKEQKIEIFELYRRMLKKIDDAPMSLRDVFVKFKQATVEELWDSHEAILAHYQNESEYRKLLNGEAGMNVLYHHQTLVTVQYMKDWSEFVVSAARELLTEKRSVHEALESQFCDVVNFCRGLSHNPLGKDRMTTNPEYEFCYDIPGWLKCLADPKKIAPLGRRKFPIKTKIEFKFTQEQFDFVEDLLNGYDFTIDGISKALFTSHAIAPAMLWRQPFVAGEPVSGLKNSDQQRRFK